jgi:hypothetical protein
MASDASVYGLQNIQPVRINTPFESLDRILQVRNQQSAARGLAEQRQAMAAEHRQKTQAAQQEAQQAEQFKALWSRTDPATGQPVMPTIEEAIPIIGGENAAKVFKGIAEVQKLKWDTQQQAAAGLAALVDGIEGWPAPDRQTPYTTVRTGLIEKGLIKPGDMPETYNASWMAQKKREAMTAAQRAERDKPVAPVHVGDQLVKPNAAGVYESVYSAPPKPEKVTYGAPQTQMVNGRRSLVRPGSDGRIYDMNLKPVDAGAIAPEPKDTGSAAKPSYEWAQTPDGTRLMTPEEIRKTGASKPAVGAVGDNKFSTAAPVLEGIKELSEKINTGEGLLATMAGGTAKLAAKANYDDDVAEYQALVSGFTPLVARALGHTGVLTQQDVDSVKALFPQPGNSKTLRDRKITRVEGIISKLEGAPKPGAAPAAKPPAGESLEHRVWRVGGKQGPEPK